MKNLLSKTEAADILQLIPRGKIPRIRTWAQWGMVAWTSYETIKKMIDSRREQENIVITITAEDDIYQSVHRWLADKIEHGRHKSFTAEENSFYSTSIRGDAGPEHYANFVNVIYEGDIKQYIDVDGFPVLVEAVTENVDFSGIKDASIITYVADRNKKVHFTVSSEEAKQAVVRLLGRLLWEQIKGASSEKRVPYLKTAGGWGGWRFNTTLSERSPESVVLTPGTMDFLLDDLGQFYDSEQKYIDLGIPYHRGYLFHGPPGTGKSSIAHVLASKFKKDVHWMMLGELTSDTKLSELAQDIKGGFLLLEDIDVVRASRDRDNPDNKQVSMEGLLNVLDGLITPRGLVVIMTTNHKELIDPAILRACRVDVDLHMAHLEDEAIQTLCNNFVDDFPLDICMGKAIIPAEIVNVAKFYLHREEEMRQALIEYVVKAPYGIDLVD